MAQSLLQHSSLISIELQEASTKQQWRINLNEIHNSDSEVTQSGGSTTISIYEVTTPEDIHELHSIPSPKPAAVTSKGSQLTTRQKWGYADPEIIPPKPISSKMSEHTTVHKGFGRFMLENDGVVFEEKVPFYPPLPNAAYNFLNKNIEPSRTPTTNSPFDGAALVGDYLLRKTVENSKMASKLADNLGDQTAQKIDWTHRLYNGGEMGSQSAPGFCISYWRDDLVKAVDNAKALGEDPFELCNKCQKRHIAWGPSIAMHDRDTCLSKLPAWFPVEEFEEPWNAFTQIINKVVRFEEIRQGRILDPNRKVWDKSYHEGSNVWTAPGRKNGGWWKCRTGDGEKETNVPSEERNCRLCHREKNGEELALEAKILRDSEEEARIHAWIERCMKLQMMKDKAVVEARIRHGLQ